MLPSRSPRRGEEVTDIPLLPGVSEGACSWLQDHSSGSVVVLATPSASRVCLPLAAAGATVSLIPFTEREDQRGPHSPSDCTDARDPMPLSPLDDGAW